MDTVIADTDWKPRAAGLATQLMAQRVLDDSGWASAFASVPRHLFIPQVVAEAGAELLAGQHEWLEAVYSDAALLTQRAPDGDGGQELPTSSSSRPAVMAVMLDRLDTRSGHRVLEVGTGTGYNTALLCHRLGGANVCSVDIHPGLIEAAREHLAEIDCHPHLSTGDGAAGWAEHAPFDRILATCAITQNPPESIRQLADGGRIVAPPDAADAGPLLVLDKTAPDEVTGRIDPYPAWFMPLREHARIHTRTRACSAGFTATGMAHLTAPTALDPAHATDQRPRSCTVPLAAPARPAGGRGRPSSPAVSSRTLPMPWPRPSSLPARTAPGRASNADRVGSGTPSNTPAAAFEALGHPDRTRFGVTALDDPNRQYIWLDDPTRSTRGSPCPPPDPEGKSPTRPGTTTTTHQDMAPRRISWSFDTLPAPGRALSSRSAP